MSSIRENRVEICRHFHRFFSPEVGRSASRFMILCVGLFVAQVALAESASSERRLLRIPEPLAGEALLLDSETLLLKEPRVAVKGQGLEIALGASPEDEFFDPLGQNLAALSDGGWAAVWSVGDFPERDVRMQWLDGQGVPRFGTHGLAVASLPGFHESSSVIVAHPVAGAFVAYRRGEGGVSGSKVFVQSYDGDGLPRWDSGGVQAMLDDSTHSDPHLVADGLGGVYICLEKGQNLGVWCQHLDADGGRDWPEAGLLAGDRPGWRVLPRGVLGDADDLLIFWRNQRDSFDDEEEAMLMEGQRFALDGTRHWGQAGLLVKTTALLEASGHSFNFYDVVRDGSGGAIVVFNDWVETSAENIDVLAQRVAADGTLPWASLPAGAAVVVADLTNTLHEATVAGPAGGVMISVSETVTSSRNDLKTFHLDNQGRHVWNEAGLALSNPASPARDYGATGFYQNGVLYWIWTHEVLPSSFTMDVYLARFRADGHRLDAAEGVPINTAPDGQFTRMTVPAIDGRSFLAVWDDRRQGSFSNLDVYAARVPIEILFADGFNTGDLTLWSQSN